MGEPALANVPATRFLTRKGETLTAFALSALEETYFPGDIRPMADNVDYQFVNGFTDVGEMPCRTALKAELPSYEPIYQPNFEIDALNLPGFNRRLEFSHFWHRPTRLRRYARTTLYPQTTGDYEIEITTCGGVYIWVDGTEMVHFEPYERNTPQAAKFMLPLSTAGSEIVMLVEELAERDAIYFVELAWLDDRPVEAEIPGSANEDHLNALMGLARSIRPEKTVFSQGDALALQFDKAVREPVSIDVAILQSVHLRHLPPVLKAHATLQPGETRAVICDDITALPDAYHALEVTLSMGETRVERSIGVATLQSQKLQLTGDLAARKRESLEITARIGEHRVGTALAMLATDTNADMVKVDAIIRDTLDAINERRDCSDFFIIPLLLLYRDYADRLPSDLRDTVAEAILGYRYWMSEPGNDVMWFWSENHVLCFHVAELLAGELFPSHLFKNSSLPGATHEKLALGRLQRWFASVEAHGLAEWNSAAYYPIDFIGLLALYESRDAEIKSRAGKMLDQLFEMIALHTSGGVSCGSMGRAYDKELRAGPLTELSPFASIAFGEGWLNNGVAALPMFCAGSYAPPSGFTELANPPAGDALSAHYVQGLGPAARLGLYKTAAVQLSASIDKKPGQKGHQQHLVDVQFAAHPFARIWVNHPGEDDPWGENRPSYWAGNGVMPRVGLYENTSLMVFDLGDNPRIDFTHAYVPLETFDEVRIGDDWLVARSGNGYAALRASAPLTRIDDGPGAGIEFRAKGKKVGWACLVGDVPEGGLDAVEASLKASKFAFDPDALQLRFSRDGAPLLMLDHARGLYCDDIHQPFPNETLKPLIRWRN